MITDSSRVCLLDRCAGWFRDPARSSTRPSRTVSCVRVPRFVARQTFGVRAGFFNHLSAVDACHVCAEGILACRENSQVTPNGLSQAFSQEPSWCEGSGPLGLLYVHPPYPRAAAAHRCGRRQDPLLEADIIALVHHGYRRCIPDCVPSAAGLRLLPPPPVGRLARRRPRPWRAARVLGDLLV